jgi:hypothetical protein
MKHVEVYRLHENSFREKEYLSVTWRDGTLTVRYARHERPDGNKFYAEEWKVRFPEPLVTGRSHRSANLMQALKDLEGGSTS